MIKAIYETATGKILRISSGEIQAGEGESIFPVWDSLPADVSDITHRIDVSQPGVRNLIERPPFNLIVSSREIEAGETLTISNIPAGTTVIYPGGKDTIDDGEIEWSTQLPGRYWFWFTCYPYIEERVHVTVKEP